MSDRLRELLRQRALVQEHLSWLDREIAAASPPAPLTPSPGPALPNIAAIAELPAAPVLRESPTPAVAAFPTPAPAAAATATTASADAILNEYRVAPDSVQQDVRRGCFLYFAAAFVLFALGVLGLYFALSSR